MAKIGEHRLIASLGRGGMADVYLAAKLGPENFTKLVVIKRLRDDLASQTDGPRYRTLMLDEARLAARLHHPNIVQTYEVSDGDGEPYMTMEFLDGRSLDQVARAARKRGGGLPRPYAMRVLAEALAGLAYAHGLSDYDGKPLAIVHRDISPSNVFWTYDGAIKLVDFGVAKFATSTEDTEVGLIKGKVPYMAPEQARGEKIDLRVDVFAMGIVMWELIAGRRLFRASSQAASLNKLLFDPIPTLTEIAPETPPAVARICARALERDPAKRYPDAAAMRMDLERELGGAVSREELGAFVRRLFADDRAAVSAIIKSALASDDPPVAKLAQPDDEPSAEQSREAETVALTAPKLSPPPAKKKRWLAPVVGAGVLVAAGVVIVATRGGEREQPAVAVTSKPAAALRLCGSNTIGAELAPALVEEFLRKKGAATIARAPSGQGIAITGGELIIDIQSRGTATGFEGLIRGDCDLAMASRPIEPAEAKQLGAHSEHVIALDGIAVIVHPSNPVNALDRAKLRDVFVGKLGDWGALGGTPGPIDVYARDDRSGTYDTFRHLVLDESDMLASGAQRFAASENLADRVATAPAAIGFIGLAYIRSAKALAIGDSLPTSFTVTTEDYLLSRRLYLYASPTPRTSLGAEFATFAMSPQGQKVVRDTGFVDLTVTLRDSTCERCPASYADRVKGARRVSLDFRFVPGTTELDSRAVRDLDRLTQAMREHGDGALLLFGFGRDGGAIAKVVAGALALRGLTNVSTTDLGDAMPIASPERNRRVEVWLREHP